MLRRGPLITGRPQASSIKQNSIQQSEQSSFFSKSNLHKNYNHNIQNVRQQHTYRGTEDFLVNKKNVDMEQEPTGVFGVKSATSPKEIGRWQLALRRTFEQGQTQGADAIKNEPTNDTFKHALNEVNDMFTALYNARDTLIAIKDFHPDEDFTAQAVRVLKTVESMLSTVLEAQDTREMVEKAAEASLDVASSLLHELKLLGIQLPEDQRRKLNTTRENLQQKHQNLESVLSSKISYQMKKPSRFSRQEMPREIYSTIPKFRWKRKRWGEISLTEHAPEIMRTSKHTDLRQQAHDNIVKHLTEEVYPTMNQLLETRAELASVFGHKTWNEMLSNRYVSHSLSDVQNHLETIAQEIREPVRHQVANLRRVRADHQEELDREKAQLDQKHKHRPRPRKDPIPDANQPISPNERYYYQQVPFRSLRQDLREYFALPAVFKGTLNIMEELFSVNIRTAMFRPEETWDILNVRKLEVYSRDSNQFMGTIYLDLFERPGKEYSPYPNITHQYIERSANTNNTDHSRTAVLMVGHGLEIPIQNLPSLLHIDQARRLFQQIGSAIGSVLWSGQPGFFAREPYAQDLKHTLPALLGTIFYKPSILDTVAQHFQSDANIPVETKFHLSEALSQWSALDLLSDTTIALQDLHLHAATAQEIEEEEDFTGETLDSVTRKHHNLLPLVPDMNHVKRFDGLLSSEMMARIYAAQIVQSGSGASRENILSNIGRRLRESVYSVGATAEPKTIVKNMLDGADVDPKYLIQELAITE
eukprot:gb/GECH01013202.1/.p1 GENE.gb/GECH01013202.1/~~gb/GECH01013202.1/.p1  ORF type:complete len:760 (+),score=191.44 gb/GECH01013202.1/:1-2280(+)